MKDGVLATKSVAEVLFKFWARLGPKHAGKVFILLKIKHFICSEVLYKHVKLLLHLLGNRVYWKMLCFLFSSE